MIRHAMITLFFLHLLTCRAAMGQERLTICADALSEVNAARAKRGLKPYLPDPVLSEAALKCAKVRAAGLIQGHCSGPRGDFAYLPANFNTNGIAAGCAAWEPSWGWGACCTYDGYKYCGAAWVLGKDGRRYMHLFVR